MVTVLPLCPAYCWNWAQSPVSFGPLADELLPVLAPLPPDPPELLHAASIMIALPAATAADTVFQRIVSDPLS
jgi:hypothetical protein